MKKFCTFLKEHAKILILKKKDGTTNKRRIKIFQDAKVCYICGKRILRFTNNKNIKKSAITVIIQVNIEAQPLVFII